MVPALRGPSTYSEEPPRNPDLVINAKDPYNAEPSPQDICRSFITPKDRFYKRNHGPIPVLDDPESFHVSVEGLLPRSLFLTMKDLRSLPKVTFMATLQCAGNRRTEMSVRRKVKGVGWGFGAVGNATWGGVKLSLVLEQAGIPNFSKETSSGGKFVEFISVDQCKEEEGGPYKASIPMAHATNPTLDVILCYEMNGEELNRDHGFPLRVIVPGIIGARSVKWLQTILIRENESQGFFVQRDYKMFPPSVDWHNIDWASRRPIMDFPVQSAITYPVDGQRLVAGKHVIRGYALSGGGRGIERVDVSIDGGTTWIEALRLPQKSVGTHGATVPYVADDEDHLEKWAWVFFEATAELHPPCQLVARAIDVASNTQPQDSSSIWNLRGVLNNSWHEVQVFPALTSAY